MADELPRVVARRFTIQACLGRGGFGEVYRARMRAPSGIESIIALKVLRSDLGHDPSALGRLRDEARLLASLDHPSILKVHDLVRLAGLTALVAEYVDGDDWSTLIRSGDRVPIRVHLEIAARVADALHAAWTARNEHGPLRLVHRDVKPANIRVGRSGQVKLLDFGVAQFESSIREARTSSDEIVGSLPYVAPERFRTRTVSGAVDVYSLGCILFHILAGMPLHPRANARTISGLALDEAEWTRFLKDRIATLPDRRFADLLTAALSHDPERRPTGDEFASSLDVLANQRPELDLRAWAAQVTRLEPAKIDGALVGRILVEEGTVATATPSLAPAAAHPALPIARTPISHDRFYNSGISCALLVTAIGLVVVSVALAWRVMR